MICNNMENNNTYTMRVIARLHGGYASKFGVPRQSGLTDEVVSRIVFEKPYRDENALRGIEGYSHLWLVWYFHEFPHTDGEWSPTVRPPRLGGNTRMGVFATRSPNRPNPIGLSSVRLVGVEKTANEGTVLLVSGADLTDGTPILDIKPYLAFTDAHTDAVGGFADRVKGKALEVRFADDTSSVFEGEVRDALVSMLSQDPRPSYQNDPERVYGMRFEGHDVHFCVDGSALTVLRIE